MNVPRPHHAGRARLTLPPREGPARQQRHLDHPGGALAAPAGEAPIEPRRPMRQPRRAQPPGPGTQPLARLGGERRLVEQALGQGAHVEPRSAYDDRLAAGGPHAGEPDARVPGELPGTVARSRLDEIQPEMRDAGELRRVGLRSADVETPVDLPRVRGDGEDGVELPPGDRDRGLAHAGRANEDGNERAVNSSQTVAPARPLAAGRWWAARARRAPGASRRAAGPPAHASPRARAAGPP